MDGGRGAILRYFLRKSIFGFIQSPQWMLTSGVSTCWSFHSSKDRSRADERSINQLWGRSWAATVASLPPGIMPLHWSSDRLAHITDSPRGRLRIVAPVNEQLKHFSYRYQHNKQLRQTFTANYSQAGTSIRCFLLCSLGLLYTHSQQYNAQQYIDSDI